MSIAEAYTLQRKLVAYERRFGPLGSFPEPSAEDLALDEEYSRARWEDVPPALQKKIIGSPQDAARLIDEWLASREVRCAS